MLKNQEKPFECTFSLFGYVIILPFCPSLVSTLAAKKEYPMGERYDNFTAYLQWQYCLEFEQLVNVIDLAWEKVNDSMP